MEAYENENKKFFINMVDFPFICRICLKKNDLPLVKVEDYLLDLFLTLTKIDVRSTASLPENVCSNCVKTLEDISMYIDISKNNYAELGKNLMHKNDNDHVETGECESSHKHVSWEKIDEYTDNLPYFKGFDICQLCYSTNILKPVEEKVHLMQLFQNITNMSVEVVFSSMNSICTKCSNKLETISLFISASLCNEMKLKNIIERTEALETEYCLEGNAIDLGYQSKVKKEDDFDKNSHCSEIKSLHTIIDIKEEIDKIPEVCMEQICGGKSNIFSESHSNSFACLSKDEFNETQGMDVEWKSSTEKRLSQQNMLIYTEENPFECDSCEKKFRQNSEEKPFKCFSCEKSFRWKANLQVHEHIHSREKPFKCDCCEKSFTKKLTLQKHMLTHTGGKPLKCDCCEKSFYEKGNLRKHMLIHSGKKSFKCDCCDKRFTQKWDLHQHMLTHSIEKPFKCDCCEKCFTFKRSLKRHSLIHSGEKPFKCECCEKSFYGIGNLR